MAKQSFSVGQVLTANQMLSLQQTAMLGGSATAKTASYTLVAADAGTVVSVNSTSATTITVNTGLFSAGDTVTIQNWGSGLVTITAGTATVNTAGSLIVPQYDGGVLYFTSESAAIYFDFVQAGAVSPLTTKGDLYTFGSSDTRIGVGANDTILTADSSTATGLKWATVASGGMTLLSTTTLSGASTTISSISQAYNELYVIVYGMTNATANNEFFCYPNAVTTGVYREAVRSGAINTANNTGISLGAGLDYLRTSANNASVIRISSYASTTYYKPLQYSTVFFASDSAFKPVMAAGGIATNSAITSLEFKALGGNLSTGTVLIYGVK
jgi:hypothetical protein